MNVKTSFGLGGGGNNNIKKVAELKAEYERLLPVLKQIEQASKNIADNLKSAKASGLNIPGGGSTMNNTMGGVIATPPPPPGTAGGFRGPGDRDAGGFMGPDGTEGGGFGRQFGGSLLRSLRNLAITGVAAISQALPPEDFIENQVARQRFGFFGGRDVTGMSFQRMMAMGTPTERMDAARAAMMGASSGMGPGLANYGTVMQNAATFSNLMPGAGLAGGMQATIALNQPRNVNLLRMVGIQVRDPATGLMRPMPAIANDVWGYISRYRTGAGPITKQDLALSLQPGNALDSMLDQFFGNDQYLRQGVVSALFQKASGAGLSKQELIRTGAMPAVAAELGELQSAYYRTTNAFTEAGVEGIREANRLLIKATDALTNNVNALDGVVKQVTKFETLLGGFNGAMGTILGGLTALLAPLLLLLSKFGGNLLKGGKPGGAPGSPTAGGPAGVKGFFKTAGGKLLTPLAALMSGYSGYKASQNDAGFWGGLAKTTATSAVAGGVVGGVATGGAGIIPGAVAAALVSALAYSLGYGTSEAFGEGGGEDVSNPLSGTPRITSPFGAVRHLTSNGRRSPTYGKPHGGVDFGVPTGTSVYAARDGVVIETPFDPDGLGAYVKVLHDDGFESLYGHLSRKIAAPGSRVKAGSLLGLSGNTGFSTGPHLHFQVQKGGQKYDPLAWLGQASSPSPTTVPTGTPGGTTPGSSTSGVYSSAGITADIASKYFGPSLADQLLIAPASMAGAGGEGASYGGGTAINYGGVNISINVPQGSAINEERLAREVKRVLEDQERINKAVNW